MTVRCGYCAIMGRPNAGKSSLLNTLVGQKIVGVSAKPNTTRNRILGIRMEEEAQLLFLDTPGIHRSHKALKLNSMMNREAWSVLADADVVLYLMDVEELGHAEDQSFLRSILQEAKCSVYLVINKCDKVKKFVLEASEEKLESLIDNLQQALTTEHLSKLNLESIYWVSAKRKESLESLLKDIVQILPEGPHLYPAEDLTDRPQKFVCSELIREQAFRLLGAELPYQLAVRVGEVEIKPGLVRIEADIVVGRSTHRGIVLGKSGQKIKEIGMAARQSLEQHFESKVYLGLEVVVDEGWVNNPISVAEYSDIELGL